MGQCFGNKEPKTIHIQPIQNKEHKLLLLGSGESGKSTLFKQMKIIHHNGYTKEDGQVYTDVIRSNLLQSMRAMVVASQNLDFPIEDPTNRLIAQKIFTMDDNDMLNVKNVYNSDLGEALKSLWNDSGIQKAYENRSEYQLLDSTEYFFNHIDRISEKGYLPSDQDILRCRVKTTGVVDAEFDQNGFQFRLIDVGGQRSERKKWIHCFEGVSAVIFVASLSEYDLKCYEDDKTMRMMESLVLFDEVCNSRYFQDRDIILFFNKVDLFKEKIEKTDLKVCFQEYDGGCNFENALKFIEKEFLDRNQDDGKNIHTFFTCATDTSIIANAFDNVKEVVLRNQLK
eukprot:gene9819-2142_t